VHTFMDVHALFGRKPFVTDPAGEKPYVVVYAHLVRVEARAVRELAAALAALVALFARVYPGVLGQRVARAETAPAVLAIERDVDTAIPTL
jgi:hypothetical protein